MMSGLQRGPCYQLEGVTCTFKFKATAVNFFGISRWNENVQLQSTQAHCLKKLFEKIYHELKKSFLTANFSGNTNDQKASIH